MMCVVTVPGCGPRGDVGVSPEAGSSAKNAVVNGTTIFAEVEVGLDFRYDNGMAGDFHFVEIAGGGAALFDYDNDGDLDVYLVQGTVFEPSAAPGEPPRLGRRLDLRDRLFRNDLAAGDPASLHFTDVTEETGMTAFGYGMGVTAGDYDNDGWVDLYVTNFGANQLWRNRGPDVDGTVTFEAVDVGAGDDRWSSSSAFVDIDRDGWLDLYVANYVEYYLGDPRVCTSTSGRRDYCGPQSYRGERDRLLHNRGPGADGRVVFTDISGPAGILREVGSGLGVTVADFDLDGWPDLYVANDLMPNVLWMNDGSGGDGGARFSNQALLAGAAVNMAGAAEASMGVDAGDFDGDGDDDLFLTHLAEETNTLYINDGRGLFEDQTLSTGLGAISLPYTGFGTAMIDYDNDGWLDLFAANGGVHLIEAQAQAGEPFPFRQRNQLLHNRGALPGAIRFEDVTESAGEALARVEVSRGIAVGDVDNDGDADVLVVNTQGPVRLLLNQVGHRQNWLGLRLVGGTGGRDQLGARVTIRVAGDDRRLYRRVRTDSSYCSANDPRVLFGLGAATVVEQVRVIWPDGSEEHFPGPPTGRYTTLRQGEGSET